MKGGGVGNLMENWPSHISETVRDRA